MRASDINHMDGGLTAVERLPYFVIRMTHLNATTAASTAHLWWRGSTFAARWRD